MSTPRRFQTTTEPNVGGWAYESEEQKGFSTACINEHFGLPAFDAFIDEQPDGEYKRELLDWRGRAFAAYQSGNRAALHAWLQAAWVSWGRTLERDHIRPTLVIGDNHSRAQSKRAKKPRGKLLPDSDNTIKDIISNLALSAEHCEETAKELWPHFFSKLDEMHLNPEESADEEKKERIFFDYKNARKRFSFERFSNDVSEFRNKKSR